MKVAIVIVATKITDLADNTLLGDTEEEKLQILKEDIESNAVFFVEAAQNTAMEDPSSNLQVVVKKIEE